MNKDKHKLYMAQILGLIFRDKDLCRLLAFKGGTAGESAFGTVKAHECAVKEALRRLRATKSLL